MDKIEAYSMLFTDSLVSNLAFNSSMEFVIHSMKKFGNYDQLIIIIVASFAFFVASCFNYLLGRVAGNICSSASDQQVKSRYSSFRKLCDKYLFFLMLFSGLPFIGKFLPLLAGISRQRFIANIVVAAVSKLIYNSIIILI